MESLTVRRLTAGLTKTRLAELAGVSTETVSRLERGVQVREPSAAKIEQAMLRAEAAEARRRAAAARA